MVMLRQVELDWIPNQVGNDKSIRCFAKAVIRLAICNLASLLLFYYWSYQQRAVKNAGLIVCENNL